MPHQSSLPLSRGMLPRQRVDDLIRQGLQQPLLVMLAGAGYGKTQAMAAYLQNSTARALWVRLNSLDNMTSHFWDHLLSVLKREDPDLATLLRPLGFPNSLAKTDALLQVLAKHYADAPQVIWVFDDFGEIAQQSIKDFLSALVEANFENFRLVLISNMLARSESVAFLTNKRFLILGKDLRFTQEEIVQLYAMHNIQLEGDELEDIERYTDGWPLPLHLLVLQPGRASRPAPQGGRLTQQEIAQMFEERFYAAYTPAQRMLLVRVSLLDSFTYELATALYEGDREELDGFGNHVFLTAEPGVGRLAFHHLYHSFLETKQYLLDEEDRQQVWRKAAEHYARTGYYFDAIGYYRKCGDHISMLYAFRDYVRFQHGIDAQGITAENAAFFLEHLDLLTPEEVREYPVADYLRAVIYLNILELEKAEALFADLEQRLLADGTPQALALLGDTYALTGALHMMRNREDFGAYYEKAAQYLPEGTNLQNRRSLLTQNNNSFSMADNRPGAKERMERAVHYGVPWANKVLQGGMSGLEHVFSGEAAYLSGRYDSARQHAYRAIYKAEPNGQHDLACNGYCLLARIGLMQGDLGEMTRQVQAVEEYAERYSIGALKDIRDTAVGWYHIKLHDFARMPKSILTAFRPERPLLGHNRSIIIYANYLISIGEYARLIGMLENPIGLYVSGGIWHDRICLYIMLAIGHYHLGNREDALKALWEAYDLTYHNDLTTLFIEAEDHMRALVGLARGQQDYSFDPAWLDAMDRESAAHTKRAAGVRAAYKKQHPEKQAADNPLTRRELDVLQALSMGMTREEIAARQYISVNTVKSFIRNIYTKLDAANRAEAVSIAISRGYIDVPVS